MNERESRPARGWATENVHLCPDGVYRWVYEMNMLKNPAILFTVWRVICLAFGLVYLFVLLLDLFDGSLYGWQGFWSLARVFLILTAVFLVIGLIAYLIVAATYGGKYIVLFEMTDEYVKHIQTPKQYEKAQALGWLAALAGFASGDPALAGAGILSASHSSTTSTFADVKTLKLRPRRHTIYVNQPFSKNQVYADGLDYDFVRDFILTRCVNARRK